MKWTKIVLLAGFGALLGALLISWLAPIGIAWYFDPPVDVGVSCRRATEWAMTRLLRLQLIGVLAEQSSCPSPQSYFLKKEKILMNSLEPLIQQKVLVSPSSKIPLNLDIKNNILLTKENSDESFQLIDGVPILFTNHDIYQKLSGASPRMDNEYRKRSSKGLRNFFAKIKNFILYDLEKDFRPIKGQELLKEALNKPQSLCVAIGGGPTRHHPKLLNLNINNYPNVDIVADAHDLPFADNSLDAVFCEAVLEHVEDPKKVVSEIFRTLKPGALVYSAVPFLQAYHGYPHHYQNFTLTGHAKLYEKTGFDILKCEVQTGPFCTFSNLTKHAISAFVPWNYPRKALLALFYLFSISFQWLDYFLIRSPNAFILASSTFLLARKPDKI